MKDTPGPNFNCFRSGKKMVTSWLAIIATLTATTLSVSGLFMMDGPGHNDWKYDKRLPPYVFPRSYSLKIRPNMMEGYFNGSITISVSSLEFTDSIIMHAHRDLYVDTDAITISSIWNSADVTIRNVTRNETTDTLEITLKEHLQIGDSYKLHIKFSGEMRFVDPLRNYERVCGFSRANYTTGDSTAWYALTHMIPKCARRVFPCFDEPSFKADFKISVHRPSNMTALSMMPVQHSSEGEEEGWVWDHFAPSPPLAPFSVSLALMELKHTKSVKVSTKHGNYSLQYHFNDAAHLNRFNNMKSFLPQALEFLEDFLDVPFPVPKLDILLLPFVHYYNKQSSMGITLHEEDSLRYGEMNLVCDLVEQWIGHAITPEWWSDFNITNILEVYLMKNTIASVTNRSSWNTMQNYDFYLYLSDPSLQTEMEYTWSVFGMYKGDWLLQMLTSALSTETVRKGLHNLVQENLYGTFDEADLWEELTEQARDDENLPENVTVKSIADSWLRKPLFPLVEVTRNYEDNTAIVQQSVFKQGKSPLEMQMPQDYYYRRSQDYNWTKEQNESKWWVPVSYLSPCNMKTETVRPQVWMKMQRHVRVANLPDSEHFVVVNPTDSGMFLVNYDQQNWNLIMKALLSDEEKLPLLSRKKVIQDVSILTINGDLSYVTFLNMSLSLCNETDYSVWSPFVTTLRRYSYRLFEGTSFEDDFNWYVRSLLTPIYTLLKKEDKRNYINYYEYNLDALMVMYQARDMLGQVGYQPFINKSHAADDSLLQSYPLEDYESGLTIFCPTFLKNVSQGDNWEPHIEELSKYVVYVGYATGHFYERSLEKCPGYVQIVEMILNSMLDTNMTEYSTPWMMAKRFLTSGPVTQNLTLSFIVQHFEDMKEKRNLWDEPLSSAARSVRTEEGLKLLSDLYAAHKEDVGYLEYVIQAVNRTLEWDRKNLPEIENWFYYVLPVYM